jgi:hypothetical protein
MTTTILIIFLIVYLGWAASPTSSSSTAQRGAGSESTGAVTPASACR